MNYLILLILLFILILTGHIHLFSKRFMQSVAPIFTSASNISHTDTATNLQRRNNQNLQTLLTAIFFLSPLVLYWYLKKTPIDNIIISSILLSVIVAISIFGLWFSAVKLKAMNQKPLTKSVLKKRSSVGRTESKRNIVLKNRFIEFLDIVADYELYNKARHHFDLGGYRIQEKGKNITPAQACFILTFFWYHEVLKTNHYINTVEDLIWDSWKSHLEIDAPLTKGNWIKFKRNYLHKEEAENKYLDLKETDFYISFKEFYDKKYMKVNRVN